MRRGAGPERPPVDFKRWKPDRCEEPGCEAKYPAFSRDGMEGPWRCQEHDRTASRRPPDEWNRPTPQPKKQDSLL